MKLLINILLLTIIILTSCHSAKETTNIVDETPNICESMTYNNQAVDNISTDYYSIDTLFINNNCLNIWVSYGGGCGDADFKLYYSNNIDKSNQPKTSLLLQLIDNDPCRAIVQQKLFYNLSFFDGYAEKDGILLEFAGSNNSLMYKK